MNLRYWFLDAYDIIYKVLLAWEKASGSTFYLVGKREKIVGSALH